MLPIATPMCPDAAAATVMAISGRFVAMASSTTPPIAEPRCKRSSSTSVVSDSRTPANQMTPAHAAKIRRSRGRAIVDIDYLSLFRRGVRHH